MVGAGHRDKGDGGEPEAEATTEVLGNLLDETLEGEPADELCGLLVLPDLLQEARHALFEPNLG